MTAPPPTYPDAEDVSLDVLADLVPDGNVGVATPADLAEHLPFIRCTVLGGTDDGVTDRPRLTIDTFAATYPAARQLANQVRDRLVDDRPHVIDGAVIDGYTTVTRPREVPWADNASIRRFTATYTAAARRRTPPST